MSWNLRRAEQYALGGTAVAFALTAWLAGSGLAIESNPVVAAVIGRIGWAGAGVLAIGIEAAIFAGYRRLEPHYPRAMRAGGWLLGAVGVGDVAVNLWLLKQVGRPETYHWHKWLPVLAVVGGVALLALWRPDPRALVGRVPDLTPAQRRVAAAVVLACLMALSGVSPGAFGPGAPTGTVERVMAGNTIYDDFEDNDLSEWSETTDSRFTTTATAPIERSYSFLHDADNGGANAEQADRNLDSSVSPTNLTFFYNGTNPDSTEYNELCWSSGSTDCEIQFRVGDGTGGIFAIDDSGSSTSSIDLQPDTEYEIKAANINWGTNYDLVVVRLNDSTTVGTVNDISLGSNSVDGLYVNARDGPGDFRLDWFTDDKDIDKSGTSGGDPPYVKTADPSGDEYVNSSDRQISLDAKVKDPEGDLIDVTVYHNPLNGTGWHQVNSTTDTSSGSWVNTTVTADDGENRWKVKTDDDVNAAENSSVYEFRVGGLFTIFNGTDLTLANQTTISAEFTSQDSNFTTSKSTTDAKMELTGLPDETLEAELSGSGYENTTIVVDDVTDPYFPILYESGASSTFDRCFELDDETGQFPPSESWIILEAYVDGDWEHIASDKFGAINEATLTIQDGEDYRVKIKNEDGDIRSAGSFTADSSFSGCRTITLQSADGGDGLDDADDGTIDGDYEWDAYLDSQDDIFWYLHLGPNSSADSLNLTIWEYQNKSNELADLEFGERGLGSNTTHTEPLTSDQANNTWVVKWNGTINGEKQSGKRIVGKSEAALGGGFTTTQDKLPNWFKALVSIGSIFVVAGLFSQLNGDVGALAVAGMGGMWFFIGWLPADVGSGVVVLAMVAAGAIFINERRTSSV